MPTDTVAPPTRVAEIGSFLSPLHWAGLAVAVFFYQWMLYSHFTFTMFEPELLDQTFNSMLEHLLHGNSHVDGASIGFEAFVKDGQNIAYFSIFCALLRAPVRLITAAPVTFHLARLSCLIATTVMTLGLIRLCEIANLRASGLPKARTLLWLTVASFVVAGPAICLAESAYVYKEPVLWGAVEVVTFLAIALHPSTDGKPSHRALIFLGCLAALAINTRPTIGIGLGLGFGLIWSLALSDRLRGNGSASLSAIAVSAVMASLGLAVALWVNFDRWGNPMVFADYHFYELFIRQPHRMEKLDHYGLFNILRLPISIGQYLTAIPYVLRHFQPETGFLWEFYDGIEGPPAPLLLTQPIICILAFFGLRPILQNKLGSATFIGQCVCALLLMMANYIAVRYTADLVGFFLAPAVFGYAEVLKISMRPAGILRRLVWPTLVACFILSIAGSHYVYVMSTVYSNGSSSELRCGWQKYAPFIPVDQWVKCR